MISIDKFLLSYTYPIAKLFEEMYLEVEPRQRVRYMINLYEGIVNYLALIGLANYIYLELEDSKVDDARIELNIPSLGSWVKLMKHLENSLRSNQSLIHLTNLNKIHREDSIFNACQHLSQLLGSVLPKKVKFFHFLDLVVQFRNDYIGHGRLNIREAKKISQPLESAITQWLEESSILAIDNLIYIDRVEWKGKHFSYNGTNLNNGTSLKPIILERNKPVTPNQVYLHIQRDDALIPLYPLIIFNNDDRILYSYSRLSEKGEIKLVCPYSIPGGRSVFQMSFDGSSITGDIINKKPAKANDLNDQRGNLVHKLDNIFNMIRRIQNDSWLTDSQRSVWSQLNKLLEPPYYVINIYGESGVGKTFIGWLLENKKIAQYFDADDFLSASNKGFQRVVLDGYDPSRRSVRNLRTLLKTMNIEQAVILTKRRAQDDIPCLHLSITQRDIDIVKASLYREMNLRIPDGEYHNLWDCFLVLEEQE